MPLFSRMGPYDVDLLRRASEQPPRARSWSTGPTWPPSCRSSCGRTCGTGCAPTRQRGHDWDAVRHRPELVDSLLAEVRERGPSHAARPRRRAAPREGALGLELVGHQEGAGVPLRRRPARRRRPQPALRAALRPARAGDPAASTSTPRSRPSRRRPSSCCAGPRSRTASAPSSTCATTSGCGPSSPSRRSPPWSSRGELLPVRIEGWRPPGLPAPRRRAAPPGARPGAAQPVRPAGLGARPHRAPLRLPLPHRDLRPRGQAGARLLRAAVPARRPDRRPGRPQGRPAAAGVLRVHGRLRRAGRPRGDRRRAGRRAAATSPAGSASTTSRSSPGATWPPSWRSR